MTEPLQHKYPYTKGFVNPTQASLLHGYSSRLERNNHSILIKLVLMQPNCLYIIKAYASAGNSTKKVIRTRLNYN